MHFGPVVPGRHVHQCFIGANVGHDAVVLVLEFLSVRNLMTLFSDGIQIYIDITTFSAFGFAKSVVFHLLLTRKPAFWFATRTTDESNGTLLAGECYKP